MIRDPIRQAIKLTSDQRGQLRTVKEATYAGILLSSSNFAQSKPRAAKSSRCTQ